MERQLYYKEIVGAIKAGRAGLGRQKYKFSKKASSFVMRKMDSDEIRTSQAEIHLAKAAGFAQGA